MKYEEIKESLKRVLALVEECECNGASAIECDLMLSELRKVYSEIRFEGAPAEAENTPQMRRRILVRSLYEAGMPAETPVAESAAQEPDAEPTEAPTEMPTEDIPAVESEETATGEVVSEAVVEDTPVEEQTEVAETVAGELPAETEQAETPEAVAEETPAAEPEYSYSAPSSTPEPDFTSGSETVLGEVLNADVQTFADTITVTEDVVGSGTIASLKDAIGLNDRFLLINELFNGSTEAFDNAIAKLDSFAGLNDCMVYIIENFEWNPHCEGAKLMMTLIGRRYGHNA